MGRLQTTDGLTDVQQEILKAVRVFVDEQIAIGLGPARS